MEQLAWDTRVDSSPVEVNRARYTNGVLDVTSQLTFESNASKNDSRPSRLIATGGCP
ncbi:MAG: hypothetical protein JW955_18410 [Sedimentisphaerales bacterium]|nr:hypothetical protein [Sedimentisphaerales bacterium]